MRTRPTGPLSLLFLVVAVSSCEKKGEGEVCTDNDECASGLTCDKHGRETGKCYAPHGHGPATDAAAGPDAPSTQPDGSSSAGTGGSGGADGGGGVGGSGGTGGSGGAGESGGSAGPDAGAASPDAAALADAPADSSSASAACTMYCQCMTTSCSTQTGYPWASSAACLQACGGFSEAQQTCWSRYCSMAAMQAESARGHACEHAWGGHGLDECQ